VSIVSLVLNNGAVTLPTNLLDELNWKPGTVLSVEVTDDGAVSLKLNDDQFERESGS
jgi:bifunctional DNA-binding transcriptional regulator/antitoxin component of YhaV-PrlF toxin-antitoxin module